MTLEMGKPINAAVQEAEKCALVAAITLRMPNGISPTKSFKRMRRKAMFIQPLGIVLAIMHLELPFLAGVSFRRARFDGRQHRPAENMLQMCRSARWRSKTFSAAQGFRKAVQTLLIGTDAVQGVLGSALAAVTLEWQRARGRSVASIAGKNIKKAVLELGGEERILSSSCLPANFDEA